MRTKVVRMKSRRCRECGQTYGVQESVSCDWCGLLTHVACAQIIEEKPSFGAFLKSLNGGGLKRVNRTFCSEACADKYSAALANAVDCDD